jgi:HlyD family secretion protein
MKKPLKIALPLILVAVIAITVSVAYRDRTDGDELMLSGNIEVTDARLSFKIPGKLEERLVDEGETVTQDQLIARLEPRDEELALARARATLSSSEARLKELETGSRQQEIDDAQAELERALAAESTALSELERAEKDDRRYAKLHDQGVIGAAEYDRFHTLYKTATSRLEESKAWVQRAREQLSLRKEGFRSEQIEQARAQVAIDQEAVNQALQRLDYTQLKAPFNGVVLSKSAEPGEYLNPGSPVVTIGDLKHPWLRAYVSERDLGLVKLGQPAKVTTDTWPDKAFEGRIVFISSEAEFTPKAVQTFEERVKLVYRIKILLDNPDGLLKPGMPADGHISVEDTR